MFPFSHSLSCEKVTVSETHVSQSQPDCCDFFIYDWQCLGNDISQFPYDCVMHSFGPHWVPLVVLNLVSFYEDRTLFPQSLPWDLTAQEMWEECPKRETKNLTNQKCHTTTTYNLHNEAHFTAGEAALRWLKELIHERHFSGRLIKR